MLSFHNNKIKVKGATELCRFFGQIEASTESEFGDVIASFGILTAYAKIQFRILTAYEFGETKEVEFGETKAPPKL